MCERTLTMEVYLGKNHYENFASFFANSQENLSIHLVTCEIYICDRFNKIFKTISELKAHYKDEQFRFEKFDKVLQHKLEDSMILK